MQYFESNPSPVTIDDEAIALLRRGFLLFESSEPVEHGIKVIAAVTPLSDGRHVVRCVYLEYEGDAPNGTKRHHERELGYLTQFGVNALEMHKHAGCSERMELRIPPDAAPDL